MMKKKLIILILFALCILASGVSADLINIGHINNGGEGVGIWGDGTYIYLANRGDGLRAYTFNGTTFSNVGHIDDGGAGYGVWGDDTYIYLANLDDGLRAYTFNGTTFLNIGHIDDGDCGFEVWGDGTYIYLANNADGLRAYTFNGTNFTNVGHIDDGGAGYGVWGDGTYIYLANSVDGLRAYTFNGSTFINVGHINNGGDGWEVWGDGTYIYLANWDDGLRAYTFNGTNFTNIGHIDDGDYGFGVWGDGTYIYLANMYDGLRAYTFNGLTFTNIGHIDDGGRGVEVWGDGTYIYLANWDDGVRAYEWENEIPIMNTSRIEPLIAYANDTLRGYCNATDIDNDMLSYEYTWFKNSVVYINGTYFKKDSITVGTDHTCGIRANDSRVLCWGNGNYGQLGDGNTSDHSVGNPSVTTDTSAYTSITAGGFHQTCGIRANDSRVLCWGNGNYGQLGDGNTNPHSVGNPSVTTDTSAYTSISTGNYHTCGIRANDSRVLCWGSGYYNQLGDGNTSDHGNPSVTTDTSAYTSIFAGIYHTCGIRANDSRVLCWGNGNYGRLGDGNTNDHSVGNPSVTTDTSAYTSISAGDYHTCGIRANDSRVLCWGVGGHGSLGDGNTSDHSVGNPNVTTDTNAYTSITTGQWYTCGIRANDSRVLCWGYGRFGRLGDGNTNDHDIGNPNITTDTSAYTSISARKYHTCGIRANDSRVLCWGYGYLGRLGDGNTNEHSVGNPSVTTDTSAYISGFTQGREQLVSILDSMFLTVGDNWILSCRAHDGTDYSDALNSSSVMIQAPPNTAPIMNTSRITPLTAYANDTLKGYCNATDADNNNISFNYTWYEEGIEVDSGTYGNIASSGEEVHVSDYSTLTKNKTYLFECLPYDDDIGLSLNSTGKLINNSVPIPISSRIDPSTAYANNTLLRGYCNATDLDGDDIFYYVLWRKYTNGTQYAIKAAELGPFPNGSEVHVTDQTSSTKKGDIYELNCTPRNEEFMSWGKSIAFFVPILNTPPVMIINRVVLSDKTLTGYCAATDLDNDNLSFNYTWFENGIKINSGSKENIAPGVLTAIHTYTGKEGYTYLFECLPLDEPMGYIEGDYQDYGIALNSTPTYIREKNAAGTRGGGGAFRFSGDYAITFSPEIPETTKVLMLNQYGNIMFDGLVSNALGLKVPYGVYSFMFTLQDGTEKIANALIIADTEISFDSTLPDDPLGYKGLKSNVGFFRNLWNWMRRLFGK